MKPKYEIALFVILFPIVAYAGLWLHKTDVLSIEQRHYCEMVDLYRKDPSTGWPDFHHSYDSECKHEQPAAR